MQRVALLIETSRAYGREILLGVRTYLTERQQPWSAFLELRDLESRPPAWLPTWNGDGLLTRTGSVAMAAAVRAVGVPTVELRSTRLCPEFPSVGIDNQAVGRICAEHLLETGLTHFGVYGLDTEPFFTERRASFLKTLAGAGHDCLALTQSGRREKPAAWERQQATLVAWVRGLPKPCGVLALTDQLGAWLLDACVRAGVSVPDEIAVLGVENDETLCTVSSPPLTSVRLGGERVGYTAAALLADLMAGAPPPEKPILLPPAGVVVRPSTDAVAVADPLLARAIRLIRDRACEGLLVSDVLEAVPLSRSSLERGLRATIGRSPREEIQRVRFARARELLAATDLTLDQVAAAVGFRQTHAFSTSFRQAVGVTPGAYRRTAK